MSTDALVAHRVACTTQRVIRRSSRIRRRIVWTAAPGARTESSKKPERRQAVYAGICADCYRVGAISRDGDGLSRCPDCSEEEFAEVVTACMTMRINLANPCAERTYGRDNMHYNDADVTKSPN